jgi:hypothetical protein
MSDEVGTTGEPGLDLHEWESERASIEEDVRDDPAAGLALYLDLAKRMLTAHGYAVDDAVAREGEDPELVISYLAARETGNRAQIGDASRAEVETALEDLDSIFGALGAGRES